MDNKKYIIFGAGRFGEEALLYYGVQNVAFFCDNKKSGDVIKGVEVIDFSKLLKIWQNYQVVLAVSMKIYKAEIKRQLEDARIVYEEFANLELSLQENNFSGKYEFINRSKSSERMLMILAGYKEFLWDDFFERIKTYVPSDIDICVMTAGYENYKLEEICERNGWSYLFTYENRLSVTQNITIRLHPCAKWIYKFDEDIFITPNLLNELMDTYWYVFHNKRNAIGIVVPIMAINSYGYRRILDRFGWVSEYEERFGDAILGKGDILTNPDVAEWFWRRTIPINNFAEEIKKTDTKFSICYHRYSIGCMLIPRSVWEEMGGFKYAPEGVLGVDEEYLCQWCMNNSYAIVVAEKAYAGHFAYGAQTERMKDVYKKIEM